jgi:glyoxylase-like metal-dependent hydrolase (beta-lactamase superfamily II)/rhodanese-related sulfurtransferase
MQLEIISTEELGDRSYVVHDGAVAVVIDPQRDLDRVTTLLDRLGLTPSLVLESHIHNDYVTGGYELARRSDARYGVNADDDVSFQRLAIRDGDELDAGTLRVRVVATPGHTDTHLAFVVTDTAHADQAPAVFTGGSLLYGSVGRTDLVDPARTEELTRAQYHSAHRLADTLPDEAPIYPTHGFGSFCSTGSAAGGSDSTIGIERTRNDALTAVDEQSFVDKLIANLSAYPAYYAHMAPLNRQGPEAPDTSAPSLVDATELAKRIAAGEWVIDLRDRVAYAADHLAGTISIVLGTQFATYVGWLAPWDTPITLIGETPQHVSDAQRQLIRIGVDRLAGAATGTLDELTAANQERRDYPRETFTAVTTIGSGDVVLDVRRDDERANGFIPGSAHLPLHSLLSRLDELPEGRLWVHCASGFRASIAASLLDRAGRDVVYIDDDYSHAVELGLAES